MADAQQLLAGVRKKYPGAYDSTPDDVLLAGVKKKFPGAYDDYELTPVAAPEQPNQFMETAKKMVPFGGAIDPAISAAKTYGAIRGSVQDAASSMVPEGPKVPNLPSQPGRQEGIGAMLDQITPGLSGLLPSKQRTAKESAGELGGLAFDQAATMGAMKGASMVGGAGKAIGSGIEGIRDVTTTPGRIGLVNKTREGVMASKRAAGEFFENTINDLTSSNPDRLVDLGPAIAQLKQELNLEPKLASAINRSPRLKMLLGRQDNHQVTLQEAQDIKNELTSRLSKSKLGGQGVRSDDIALFDTIDDVREAQLLAFPDETFSEFKDARQKYGETMRAYDLVRNKVKPGNLEKNIYSKFGGDVEVGEALNKLLPKELLDSISRARTTRKVGQVGKLIGGTALGTTAVGSLLKKILGSKD